MGQLWQQPLPVSRAVFAVLLKLDDAVTDEPVPQREADVDSLGGKVLSPMVNLDNCGDQRFEIAGYNGADFLFLEAIAETLQIAFDGLLQNRSLGELGVQFADKARHLFLEGVAVVFDFLGANVAARRENVAVRGDFGGGGGFAEAGDVGILTRRRGDAEARRNSEAEVFFSSAFSAPPPEPAFPLHA